MRRAAVAIWFLVLCSVACSAPPQKEIDRAQGAIEAARAAGADQYATEPFNAAITAMRETHDAVQQRDYRLALSRATDANERALEAARLAADGKARAHGQAEAAVGQLATTLRHLEVRLKDAQALRVPARELEQPQRVHADAERTLQEARRAMAAGNYLDTLSLVKDVPEKIAEQTAALSDVVGARSGRGARRKR